MALSFLQNLRVRSDDACAYTPWFLLGALVILFSVHPQLPADDALRHVVSYAWGYSHTAMYPMSSLTEFNQYPLFDLLVGKMSQAVGVFPALKLMQTTAIAAASVSFFFAFRRWLPIGPDRHLDATVLALLLLCTGVGYRAFLARPELFAMAWAVLALALPARRQVMALAVYVLAGFVVSASYWVAWLSWPLLWLAPVPARRRIVMLGLIACFHALFWQVYTQGAYWHVLDYITGWNAHRLISVNENGPIQNLATKPAVVVCVALAVAGWRELPRTGFLGPRFGTLLALAPYLILNMVRYVGTMLACVLPLIAAGWVRLQLNRTAKAVLSLALFLFVLQGIPREQLPDFKVPPGSKVLTTFGTATFAIPMANPGTVRTLPAMEVGASDARVQVLARGLARSSVDCSALRELGVTHLVENSWVGNPAQCMELDSTRGGWRLWEVR